jgi:mono/diheme cytochrome c family protein
MQLTIRRLHRGLAWLILVGLVGEVYLVGTALFGVTTLQPHRSLGYNLSIGILGLLVLALVADRRRRILGLSTLLFVLTVIQVFLPSVRSSVPWVAALHAINAIALMGVTLAIALSPRATPTPAETGDLAVDAGTARWLPTPGHEFKARGLILLVAALVLVGLAVVGLYRWDAAGIAPTASGNDAAVGQRVFATTCNSCHPNANAGIGPALHGSAFASRYPDDNLLVAVIRQGKGGMPAFSPSELSDVDLAHVVAYMRSLGTSEPAPEPTSTPRPRVREG